MHNNQRRNYFIDKNFQTKFILKFCFITILAAALIGILLFFLSSQSTTVAIENTKINVKTTADFLLPIIIQTLLLVTLFSAILVAMLTLFVSHKIAGPLYRLKHEIDKLGQGDLSVNFHIRSGDQLRQLSDSLTAMASSLKDKIASLKRESAQLKLTLQNSNFEGKKQLEEKINSIEETLNNFKGL
jgi:methyl-accepting chemotaxis protein